jgi:hypothetical protein
MIKKNDMNIIDILQYFKREVDGTLLQLFCFFV